MVDAVMDGNKLGLQSWALIVYNIIALRSCRTNCGLIHGRGHSLTHSPTLTHSLTHSLTHPHSLILSNAYMSRKEAVHVLGPQHHGDVNTE